ncbi:hypothetical protein CSPAE12_08926 [Colletotrichum incanum]|nr:hypothetical protein CSPAE12_08926 [Colletotrichum incanum]
MTINLTEDKREAQELLNTYTNFLGGKKTRLLFCESSKLPRLLLRDSADDLPIPNFFHTADLGAEVRSLQTGLAYFLQVTSGVSNDAYDHVGAVGCDVVQKGDGSDGGATLNFRLAKNNGLHEEDVKFMGILLGLLEMQSGNVFSDVVETLALRHLLVRVNHDVNVVYKRVWNNPGLKSKALIRPKTTDERYGRDYIIVLTWLLDKYEPQELHCLGINRRIVIRECGRKSTHGTTEIAKVPMAKIVADSSLRSVHLLQLHQASQAACRLLHNRIASEIRNGLRSLLEYFRKAGLSTGLCSTKEEELIRIFPFVLTDIAEPLLQLGVITGFLGRYRSQLADANAEVAVRFFSLTAPRNPTVMVKDNQLKSTRTRVGLLPSVQHHHVDSLRSLRGGRVA